jgi:hypothetical protein
MGPYGGTTQNGTVVPAVALRHGGIDLKNCPDDMRPLVWWVAKSTTPLLEQVADWIFYGNGGVQWKSLELHPLGYLAVDVDQRWPCFNFQYSHHLDGPYGVVLPHRRSVDCISFFSLPIIGI